MLGPIGSDLMRIFRLLTPDEIDRYIESKEVKTLRGAVAAGAEEFSYEEDHKLPPSKISAKKEVPEEEGQAKIIPIGSLKKNQRDVSAEHEEIQVSKAKIEKFKQKKPPVEQSSDLESIGVLSADSLRKIEQERLDNELKDRDSTTAFLIKERSKMRESKKRLIEQHAFKSYQTNATQEFYDTSETEENDEDESLHAKGILINKRHY